jgi:thioredoxin 1
MKNLSNLNKIIVANLCALSLMFTVSAYVSQATDSSYAQQIKNSKNPVVVIYHSPECPACKLMMPVFEEVSNQLSGKYTFISVDNIAYPQLGGGIHYLPTIAFFSNGHEVSRTTGNKTREKLIELIKNNLG